MDFGDGLPAGVSFRAIWMHEFLRQTAGLVDAEFASLPGAGFAIRGLDLGRDWAVVGPGITWAVRDRVSLFANYDVQFNAVQVYPRRQRRRRDHVVTRAWSPLPLGEG